MSTFKMILTFDLSWISDMYNLCFPPNLVEVSIYDIIHEQQYLIAIAASLQQIVKLIQYHQQIVMKF